MMRAMKATATRQVNGVAGPIVTAAARDRAREQARQVARDVFVRHAQEVVPPAALARAAQASHLARKWQMSARSIDATFARNLARIEKGSSFWQGLGILDATQLRRAAELEPALRDRFASEARQRQQGWMTALHEILTPRGLIATGKEKAWDRTVSKLTHLEQAQGRRGFIARSVPREPMTILDLTDVARARIDLPDLRPTEMRRLVNDLKEELQERFPGKTLAFEVRDTARRPTVRNAEAVYKGRIHLRVQDVTGGRLNDAFEIQLGPRQLTRFWDTPFGTPGLTGTTNIHDAIYKGVSRLENPEHVIQLGTAFSTRPISPDRAHLRGIEVIEETIDLYQAALMDAMQAATLGVDFPPSRGQLLLTERIGEIRKALAQEAGLPEGLALHP